MSVTIYYSVPTVSSRQRDRNQLCSVTSHVQIEITQQIMFTVRWLLVEFPPKIDNSGNVSNKGLCREEQIKFTYRTYLQWSPKAPGSIPTGGNFFAEFILLFPASAFIANVARIIYFRENFVALIFWSCTGDILKVIPISLLAYSWEANQLTCHLTSCSYITLAFAFTSNIYNRWWCSHLKFTFSRTGSKDQMCANLCTDNFEMTGLKPRMHWSLQGATSHAQGNCSIALCKIVLFSENHFGFM